MKKIFFTTLVCLMMGFVSANAMNVISVWPVEFLSLNDDEVQPAEDDLYAALTVDGNQVFFSVVNAEDEEMLANYVVGKMEKASPMQLDSGILKVFDFTIYDIDEDYENCDLSISYNEEIAFLDLEEGEGRIVMVSTVFSSDINRNLDKLYRVLNTNSNSNRTIESYF